MSDEDEKMIILFKGYCKIERSLFLKRRKKGFLKRNLKGDLLLGLTLGS